MPSKPSEQQVRDSLGLELVYEAVEGAIYRAKPEGPTTAATR
jgi:hypothetical protein